MSMLFASQRFKAAYRIFRLPHRLLQVRNPFFHGPVDPFTSVDTECTTTQLAAKCCTVAAAQPARPSRVPGAVAATTVNVPGAVAVATVNVPGAVAVATVDVPVAVAVATVNVRGLRTVLHHDYVSCSFS